MVIAKHARFSRGFSLYLDLIRVSAALAVVFFHATFQQNGGDWFHAARTIGPDAVIVFFVLSGLVISYVVDTKESSPRLYISSRLARLWSVLIPALAVTYLINLFGVRIYPALPNWIVTDGSAWRLLPSAFFVNELWFVPVVPLSDIPVWSIGFEFWYYVFFGVIIFAPEKWRYIAVSVVALLAGPRILLLFPIWLLGVADHRLNDVGPLENGVDRCRSKIDWRGRNFGTLDLVRKLPVGLFGGSLIRRPFLWRVVPARSHRTCSCPFSEYR